MPKHTKSRKGIFFVCNFELTIIKNFKNYVRKLFTTKGASD